MVNCKLLMVNALKLISIILLAFSFTQLSTAQTLDEKIQIEIKDFKGKVWIYAKNLDSGKDYSFRAEEEVRTASTIKLPIMAEAFRQVAAGKFKWSDQCVITKENKVGGSGILREFSDNSVIDLKTAVHLMIVLSDNTATNLVLDKITADSVNDFMDTLGMKQTRSLRKVFGGGDSRANADPRLQKFGLGVSSPKDMVKLLEKIENGEIVSKEASAEMIAILKRQQYKDALGRNLKGIQSASKSGSLDALRSDVGIIYTKNGRIAMAITVDEMPEVMYTPDNPGLYLIWKLSQILQEELGK